LRIGINTIFLISGKGGGIERYTRNLIKALKKIDKENEYIIFTNRDNTGSFELSSNFQEYFSPVSARIRPAKILWEQLILPFQLKRKKIDVLLSPGNVAPLFPPCPSILIIHDLLPFVWPENFNKVELYSLKALIRLGAQKATKKITVSKNSQKEIVRYLKVPMEKTAVVYPGCDEIFLYGQISQEEKSIKRPLGIDGGFILCTASTRPYKNLDRLLVAFSLLKKGGLEHRLVIAGLPGRNHRSILNMIKALELEESVVFTEYVSDKELLALYSTASVLVYPSLYEGFGLPVLEAMACGTPVAASNTTSLPEVVGEAGRLFNPYDPEEIAEAVYQLIKDTALRNIYIAKGRERVNSFSWEKTTEEMLSIFTLAAKRCL